LDYVLLKLLPENLVVNDLKFSAVHVYPNPTSSIVNVNALQETIQSIQLLDLQGRILQNKAINALNCQVDLSSYQKGTYFLKFTINDVAKVVKVLKD